MSLRSYLVDPAVALVFFHTTMPGITPSVISEPIVAAFSAEVVDKGMLSFSGHVNHAEAFDA